MNTWAGVGAAAAPEGAQGLRTFTVLLPDQESLEAVRTSVTAAGYEGSDGEASYADPSGNRVVLRVT